jgi:hypothetical protein
VYGQHQDVSGQHQVSTRHTLIGQLGSQGKKNQTVCTSVLSAIRTHCWFNVLQLGGWGSNFWVPQQSKTADFVVVLAGGEKNSPSRNMRNPVLCFNAYDASFNHWPADTKPTCFMKHYCNKTESRLKVKDGLVSVVLTTPEKESRTKKNSNYSEKF